MTENKSMLECTDSEIGALLMSYSLGTLSDTDTERFELHLLHCPACQQEMESASLSLNALSEVREQFIARAHQENEDFESQYDKLVRDKRTVSAEVKPDRSRGWLESFWEAVWGRKWIIGTVGAVVIAMLFVLREGPNLTQPSAVKDESVSMHYALKPPKAGMTADTSAAWIQPMNVEMNDTVRSDTQPRETTAMPLKKSGVVIPVPQEVSPQSKTTVAPVGLADESEMMAAEELAIEGTESIAEVQSVQLDVVQKSKSLEPRSGVSQGSIDNSQIAEIVLGKFDPDLYSNMYADQEAESPEAIHSLNAKAPGFKVDQQLEHKRAIKNDSLIVKQSPAEAWDSDGSQEKRDTTDASPQIKAGVSSLAAGDYAAAKSSLETAYSLMPRGVRKHDVGLLLARVDIMTGQFEEAKGQLRIIAEAESDSVRKAFAQSAVAKVDSFINSEALKQAPPK